MTSAHGPGGTIKANSTVNVNTKVDAGIDANAIRSALSQDGRQDHHLGLHNVDVADVGERQHCYPRQPERRQEWHSNRNADPADTSKVPDGQPARTIDEQDTPERHERLRRHPRPTASVHITGTVEPIPAVALQSIFYPTDYPGQEEPASRLGEQPAARARDLGRRIQEVSRVRSGCETFGRSHADDRGSKPFNQDLSERRVERIKQYLVDQGISADKVQTAAYGKERPMEKAP